MVANASLLRTNLHKIIIKYTKINTMKKAIKIMAIAMVLILSVMALVACDLNLDFPFDGNNTGNGGSGNGTNNGSGNGGSGTGNNNGTGSGKKGTYTLDVYGINDLHGKFEDSDGQPGIDEMTTYLRYAQEDQNTIFLSAGDMWQGSCESGLTKGNIITDWMNDLGFSAMTLGNHEFDWGIGPIQANAEIAEFPILAINVYDLATGKRLEGVDASTVIDKGDVQIGIIGAVGDCYSSISSDKVKGVEFKTDSTLTSLVKAEAIRLREEEGADFIIYSLHDGGESSSSSVKEYHGNLYNDAGDYYDLSLSDGYIDLVFEAHTHQNYIVKDDHGVYHLQGGGDNKKGITHANVVINLENGQAEVKPEFIAHSTYASEIDDPIVDTLMEKYDNLVGTMNDSLGTNKKNRNSADLADRVAQLYFTKGKEKWGGSYNIILGGGDINVRSPYNLNTGDITYSMLYMLFPFDNEIVLCSLTGAKLSSRFLSSRYGYVTYGYENQTINTQGTYYIVTDTWNSSYAANGLKVIDYYAQNYYARDMLADFAKAGGFN